MKKILLLTLFFYTFSKIFAHEMLLFEPLTANHLESRIGTFYQPTADHLRLDIGHSLDLIEIPNNKNANFELRAGADFFILSRLRSEGRLKFPVEASDFFFGLNLTGNISTNYFFRMRIAHISSHLVDGYTIDNNFIKEPFVYSREFVDLILTYNTEYVRTYIGGTAIFSTIPKDINVFVPQIGFDSDYELYNDFNFIGGYDFKLVGLENENTIKYFGSNSAQIGIKYKLSENRGLSFNFYYYSGLSIHGMFYNKKEKYKGFGIQFHY